MGKIHEINTDKVTVGHGVWALRGCTRINLSVQINSGYRFHGLSLKSELDISVKVRCSVVSSK